MAYKLTATDDSKVFEFKAEGRKFTLTQETQKVAHIQAASKAAKGLRAMVVHIVAESDDTCTVVACDFPCTAAEAQHAAKVRNTDKKAEGFRVIPMYDIVQAMELSVCMLKG